MSAVAGVPGLQPAPGVGLLYDRALQPLGAVGGWRWIGPSGEVLSHGAEGRWAAGSDSDELAAELDGVARSEIGDGTEVVHQRHGSGLLLDLDASLVLLEVVAHQRGDA